MIAGAEDAISCDLGAGHDRTLMLYVDGDELSPGAYRAAVWASHSGNEMLRREIPVTQGQTEIELASDVDHIGFADFSDRRRTVCRFDGGVLAQADWWPNQDRFQPNSTIP